jgi:hypothetical protein
MGRTWVTFMLALGLAACGDDGPDTRPATRHHCIAYVAHSWMLEDLAAMGVGDDFTNEVMTKPKNEEEALKVIATAERGMLPPDSGVGEGERRIARCMAERTRGGTHCAVNARTAAAMAACPK